MLFFQALSGLVVFVSQTAVASHGGHSTTHRKQDVCVVFVEPS